MQLGQSRTLPVEKPEQIDLAQAARYFGARGEADTATMALLQRCAVPLLAAATPRAVWLRAEVKALAEAGILRGSDVMRHLEGCGQAILLAVTLGPGVDAQIRRAGVGDIAAGVASDALGSALAEQTADAAEAELRQLAAAGYREVVLSAISLPSYGLDTGTNLVELVEKCAQVEGIERIRLGSLDPDMLTPEFITRLAAVDKLCPQFHLSLQSGCTATLRRMRRVYTAEQYAQVVDQIRAAYGARPVSFTTDCICGFPGETPEDFAESCDFLKKIGFLKVHVFPYSRRSGTPAYDFPDQVHEREKQARSREMNALAEQVRCEVLAAHEGTEDDVLLETPLSGTLFTGYTRLYIPVVVSAPGRKSGEIVHVRLGPYDGERVRATLC